MNRLKTLRRWCILQAVDAIARLDFGQASMLWGKQEAQAGTPIPTNCPAYAKLTGNHYATVEDIDGANIPELQRQPIAGGPGLTASEAKQALAFLGLTVPADTDFVPADPKHIG